MGSACVTARMGLLVYFHHATALNLRVGLRRGERAVAQQLLNAAQISTAIQQMRGEGMTKGMRRRALGQTQPAAEILHQELRFTGAHWLSAAGDEEWRVLAGFERQNSCVSIDSFTDLRQKRHGALFSPFADNHEGLTQWRVFPSEA